MLPSPLKALFLAVLGEEPHSVQKLKGDASERGLYRLVGTRTKLVGVWNPLQAEENAAFLGFSRHFRRHGLPVPAIHAADLRSGAYLEQDLGTVTLLSWLDSRGDARWAEGTLRMYRKVLEYLPLFQVAAGITVDWALCYQGQEFDGAAMMRDLRYFQREFLDPFLPQHPDVSHDFGELVAFLDRWPRDCFMYRDFQARNVMLVEGEPWFLDYQSGRRGPVPYDAASMLFDAAARMPHEARTDLLDAYVHALGKLYPVERDAFSSVFPAFALLRILQALGAYGFLSRVRSKTHFLARVPAALGNLTWLMRQWHAPLPALRSLWETVEALQEQPHLGYLA